MFRGVGDGVGRKYEGWGTRQGWWLGGERGGRKEGIGWMDWGRVEGWGEC